VVGHRLRVLASTLIKTRVGGFYRTSYYFQAVPASSHQNQAQPVISRSLSSFLHSGRTLAPDLRNLLQIRTVERPLIVNACVGVRKKKMCSLPNADLVIVNPRDVILKITCAICGSDCIFYSGLMPTMEKGDVLS
jgi:hypothetical protein